MSRIEELSARALSGYAYMCDPAVPLEEKQKHFDTLDAAWRPVVDYLLSLPEGAREAQADWVYGRIDEITASAQT